MPLRRPWLPVPPAPITEVTEAGAVTVLENPGIPSVPKRMIDAALTEWRHLSILDAEVVRDLLLDLRAEV